MSKEITLGHNARLSIKKGIDKAVSAVAPTLGAVGMSAIIEVPGLLPLQSDDGITILKNLSFKDPYEQIGLELVRDAALRTSREGGDGTATTSVLTQAIVDRTISELGNNSETIRSIKQRLENGLQETLELLKENVRPVGENIEEIANISSLDSEMASLIAEVIKQVGVNGVVTVEKGAKLGYSSEVVKGARFNKGLVSPFFITDHEKQEAVLDDPFIVLIDRKVSTNEQILSILNSIGTGNDILFIADDIDSVALGTLAHNAVNKVAKIAAVRNPYTGQRAEDFLFDIGAITGGTVISEQRGMKLDQATKDLCGHAVKVIVTRDHTTIIAGHESEELESRIKSVETQIGESTSAYVKSGLEERLAALTGGIGVIRVGTYTDTEFASKKLKFDNAINATQAALQEGIVAGGGTALYSIALAHSDPIFQEALQAPFKQQCINAETEPISPLIDFGINFKTKETVNMFDAGIIDPYKVLRLALESAVAIASTLSVGEIVIVNEVENHDE